MSMRIMRLQPVVWALALIALNFNNCAKLNNRAVFPTNSMKSTSTAPQMNASIGKSLATSAPARAPASVSTSAPAAVNANTSKGVSCADSSLYTCVQQQFGTGLENSSVDGAFACVTLSDGSYICPSGQIRTYNTAGNVGDCADNDCLKKFEYSEYVCQLKMPGANAGSNANSTVSNSSSQMSAALQQVYNNCLKLVANN